MMSELRMNAYYYCFESTGVREIDLILSAVATAGKMFHHTEDWNDECYEGEEGKTPVERIQHFANLAAAKLKEQAEND